MRFIGFLVIALTLSACSIFEPLVYRIDIPQGNYIEQKDVDKLRVGMSQEQVEYVLGTPVAENAFRSGAWHYIYHLKPGRGPITTRELIIYFTDERVTNIEGDFNIPENFFIPLDA
ncbi:outer membrane protein assembly factor BamE [Aliidiomarina quisquiliarum]|uniref:outer membrane protein assembly factor BamE n=1 Tax=Aliidiomarina quisquiliarum TaxID=2938947 RepID=UPI00208E19F3|nr:outer membrane protein assembly factor BamE [Aliidiomarina quisquiliarum]MCO4321995.1 outer membrane protein assembly factor BamE [Aliidiomarina quisquiliarum]